MMAATQIWAGRAFRRAMLSLIEEGKPPGYWAPFVVVGEGGVALR
jgi:CHAT domain-containing protein